MKVGIFHATRLPCDTEQPDSTRKQMTQWTCECKYGEYHSGDFLGDHLGKSISCLA